jgi:hypothetical protein
VLDVDTCKFHFWGSRENKVRGVGQECPTHIGNKKAALGGRFQLYDLILVYQFAILRLFC